MPILSGYNSPVQQMPQYVPLPFDAMLQAGQQLQSNANTFREVEAQNLSDIEGMNAIPNSEQEIYLKNYLQSVKDLQAKYGKENLTNPQTLTNYKADLGAITNFQRLSNIQQSWDNYILENKNIKELNSKQEIAKFIILNS